MELRAPALASALGLALLVAGCGGAMDSGDAGAGGSPHMGAAVTAPADGEGADKLHFTMERLNGDPEPLAKYRGKVVLVVNTASECGFTPQFEPLEALYREKRGMGFVILGFPANDFAGQEPRSNREIARFCKANFGVSFPMFAKVHVIGDQATPLFREMPPPDWNFNKYLLDRRGRLVDHWGSVTEPDDPALIAAIDAALRS
jgi:glutathione peroxidase